MIKIKNNKGVVFLKQIQLLLFLLLLLGSQAFAQSFLKTEGKKIINEQGEEVLLRGMGLGGWMVQEGYMLQTASFANPQHQIRARIEDLIGVDNTNLFYNAWLENHVSYEDIAALSSWGFNSVRLPMHYNLFTLPIEEETVAGEQSWLDKGFELTDRLLEWCEEFEMYLILDLHAAPGGQGYDQGISDYDPSKPSLWESSANQEKTVALWRRLAEHYKDEPWIGGYDLINEPNWDMDQNKPLKDLYQRITDTIREVDTKHLIFIEGNWFANDFTGLTPPWDNNMVYSPHKYWSINDQASIQWVLNIRDNFNIPLYLGESGENSNVWFKDAIELLEENDIGWAWWPMKKIEAIAGPLSVEKTAGYQQLLDYWSGNGPRPDTLQAFEILMDLTEKLKYNNCRFQADVIDAMFRQQENTVTLPFSNNNVPGVVYATNYDMGSIGSAYFDTESATYHVSTNNYTAWNNGWAYRNDGVDIEICEDDINTNGYNVAWIDEEEWLKYSLNVQREGIYDVRMRVASSDGTGGLFFEIDESKASEIYPIPATGDFQNWQNLTIPNLFLQEGTEEVVCRFTTGGFNLSSLEFIHKGNGNTQAFTIRKATTLDRNTITMQFSKPFEENNTFDIPDFNFEIDGTIATINEIDLDDASKRILTLRINENMRSDQQLRVSYQGDQVKAIDQTLLSGYQRFFVENTLAPIQVIPGIIQAEDFTTAQGIELENALDIGQGQNIGYLDAGDWIEYEVVVNQTAPYILRYRVASENTSGRILLKMIDSNGNEQVVDRPSFPVTGGWQSWQTVESEIDLVKGDYTLRIEIINAPFNLNWMEFESLLIEEPPVFGTTIYPTYTQDQLFIDASYSIPHELSYFVFDMQGRLLHSKTLEYSDTIFETVDISDFDQGLYYILIELEDETRHQSLIFKY